MLDMGMVLTLIAVFALMAGFVVWCGRTAEDTGGERE
ncbi:hypothetical protein SAMN04488602_12528 [Paenibacillus sp. cl123]|nr:hypothetical protein SAMN04488602_12528 [Paenibacillus sp. cl123]